MIILFGMFWGFADGDAKSSFMEMGVRGSVFSTGSDYESINDTAKMLISAKVSPLFGQVKKTIPEEAVKAPADKKDRQPLPRGVVSLKNETDYEIDVQSLLKEKLKISTKNPRVLIVHTHASESYTPDKKYYYEETDNYRTDDCNYNMIRVGEELAKVLESNGIDVIHDKTINDRPSYNASYNKTKSVIESHLKKDSDIAFVFDIHRDALGDEGNAAKFVKNIGGEDCAQVMMVCGTDTNLDNPHWRENLKLALNIQSCMEGMYPGFMRPVNLRRERFNMHLTTGSLIFEVGANGNTLTEAIASARYLGEGLAEFIKECIK